MKSSAAPFAVLLLLIGFILGGLVSPLSAQQGTVTIESIEYQGLRIWSPSNVTEVLDSQDIQEDRTYDADELQRRVNRVIEELQDQGFFSDIQVSRDDGRLIFQFEEFNRISDISYRGNNLVEDSRLNDVLLLQSGDPVNPFRIEQARKDLVNYYRQEGYSNISVESEREVTAEGQVDVTFVVDEGQQNTINDVTFHYSPELSFYGEAYRNLNLNLILPAKPGQPYSEQIREESVRVIQQWYSTLGYLDASVEVETWRNLSDDGIDLEFYIEQGAEYRLGEIDVSGNDLYADTELRNSVELEEGDVFNTRQFTLGIRDIEQRYRNRGYADVAVDYNTNRVRGEDPPKVNVTLNVEENDPVYVERIEIHGNYRTYDRVIRREIRLEPGGLLDGEKRQNSLRRLRNLGYFSEVEMNIDPGSKENWKVVRVRVKEGRTGQFQFGGGFSSSTGFTGNLSIRKDNFSLWDYSHGFTGRGQSIQASAQMGSRRSNFNINWDDPWFNDDLDDTSGPQPNVPLGFGWSAYNTRYFRDEGFDEIREGGALRLSREFGPARSNQVDAQYSFNTTRVENLDEADNELAIEFENEADRLGTGNSFEQKIGSIRLGIQRDRRDNRLFPTEGYFLRLQNRTAAEAFAGDVNFYNPELDARSYVPFWGQTFWATRFNYKTLDGFGGGNAATVPSFEKFFLGGNQNVRGYEYRDIAIYGDCDSDPEIERCRGGRTAFFANLELRYKVMEQTMQLFAFTDIGNVYDRTWEIDSDFKQSAGIGMRVRSPMGPINISWAQRMDPTSPIEDDAGETQIDFNIGTGF